MSNCPEMMDGWFGRDTEYVPFDDENIVDKINYYLDHEEERKHISHCLYETYRNNYSPVHFWTKILKICGVNS
jgi:spore maturation protein CgeB